MVPSAPNPINHQLPVATAQHILRLLQGDRATEEQILAFLRERYGAPTVLHIPPHIAKEIIRRPGDFIRAARQGREPEFFGDEP